MWKRNPDALNITSLWTAELPDIAVLEKAHSTDPLLLPQLKAMWESETPAGGIGAYRGNRHVGHLVFGKHGRRWWIASLLVLPEERRRGVGRKLVEEFTKFVPVNRSVCVVVRDTADPAQRFLRAAGFTALKVLPDRFRNPTADGYLFAGDLHSILGKSHDLHSPEEVA